MSIKMISERELHGDKPAMCLHEIHRGPLANELLATAQEPILQS